MRKPNKEGTVIEFVNAGRTLRVVKWEGNPMQQDEASIHEDGKEVGWFLGSEAVIKATAEFFREDSSLSTEPQTEDEVGDHPNMDPDTDTISSGDLDG